MFIYDITHYHVLCHTLADASRIQQVTLEAVNYYDDYAFVNALDTRLASGTTNVSARGLCTGSVTYNSEDGRSMSAMYYDIRGNVTELREIMDFGTLLTTSNTYTFNGPVIYRNRKIDMVQFPGGYATIDGTSVTFHYYTQDYLGNNRAVVNGSTGAIEQTTAYYPYGAVIADLGTGNSGQPFKFIGKELISANGLNEYDFGARRQYPAIPQFTSIDPLCEKRPDLSPYLYCGNDPINAFDPNGMYIVDENA